MKAIFTGMVKCAHYSKKLLLSIDIALNVKSEKNKGHEMIKLEAIV